MADYTFEMTLEWANIFEQNADMGDPTAPPKSAAGSIARKGGQTVVNAYFNNQEDLDKLIADGLDLKPLGNDRILEGNENFGIGKFIKLKRGVADDIRTFKNNKGEPVEVNFGGLPKVVNATDMAKKSIWDYEKDGKVGNGSIALVNFEVYSDGAGVRLKRVAVTELVVYEGEDGAGSEHADVWDV